jgi:hypothetical protein
MASGNTELTANGILKEYYPEGAATNETYEGGPFWALMEKKQIMTRGRTFVESVVFGSSQGASSGGSPSLGAPTAVSNFPYAQQRGQVTGTQAVEFVIYRKTSYRDFSIATEAVLSTQDAPDGAFESELTLETDNNLRYFGNNLEIYTLGQNGNRGQVGNLSFTTAGLQILNIPQAVNFEIGQELDVSATLSGGTVKAYGTEGHGLYVGYVDPIGNFIVCFNAAGTPVAPNDAAGGIPTIANGDYIFLRTDYGNVPYGLQDWIPYGGPSATPFNGINRTAFTSRLAGSWMDGTQKTVEEYLIDIVTLQKRISDKPFTHFIFPWGQYGELMKSGTAKRAVVAETEYDVSFEGVKVYTPSGPVVVLPCRNCPPNRVFAINIDTWKYMHLGKEPVNIFNLDGMALLRQPNDDGLEGRMFSMGNLVCTEPWANATIAVQPL